ncbi:N-acetyltransferase family protein [Streptococcus dentapri]|uniref:GNAT family N-acetyltransferase n=1 Tax=Streptococcus dentapri TaxID=573564 RepID=A0ABV8D1J7_9STRE
MIVETDLITKDSEPLSEIQMFEFLEKQLHSPRDICILAKLEGQIIGLLNLVSHPEFSGAWAGDVFLVIAKDYRGHGLGGILMEMVIDWAQESDCLTRLILTVQVRNKPAIHLYQKFGFEIDGLQTDAVLSKENHYLEVYAMSRPVNKD